MVIDRPGLQSKARLVSGVTALPIFLRLHACDALIAIYAASEPHYTTTAK